MVIANIHTTSVSGRGSGTQTNLNSTATAKNLENPNMQTADQIQKRNLAGIFTPSQGDTYSQNANSQTHWNRLTEWIALANIFPVNFL